MSETFLQMSHITKRFPGVLALSNVDFALRKGEVHALLGENGAGKSTLMKILSGVYQPDEGDIIFEGQSVSFANPLSAQSAGITIIHQEFNLFPELTVEENIFIGREFCKNNRWRLDEKQQRQAAIDILQKLTQNISPETLVADLSVDQQQMVEIAKAISVNAKILIMDEPTAALTETEIDSLFQVTRLLKEQGTGIVYISHRLEELALIADRAPLFAGRHVSQLHWGGGTPTYLNKAQISRLMSLLRGNFNFNDDAEISIEVDPREIELDVLDHLRAEGFNRLSMGVQDFNKEVQRLVNREQDEEFIFALLNHAREIGFTSTNIDLIYGLPKQTTESFAFTLKRVAELNPDRLSVFNYAHLPTLFAAQRKIKDADLPSAQQKLDILQETISSLTETGYQFIGMDHFARPDDELAIAQRKGVLHRNFQGYTTQGDTDLLGMGVSAISMIGDNYAQNQKELKRYYQQVDEQGDALWRGIALTRDDCIRRDVIKLLICNFRLDYAAVEQQWALNFADYFAEDLKLLAPLAKDGLVDVDEKGIQVTPKGRLLIRNICMCFDAYLRQKARMQQFSRVI